MAEKSQWYYVQNQDRVGPVTQSELKRLAKEGVINEQTLVWKEGMKDWEKARMIKGLFDVKQESVPQINVDKGKKPRSSSETFKTGPSESGESLPKVQPASVSAPAQSPSSEAVPTIQVNPTAQPAGVASEPTPIQPTINPAATAPVIAGGPDTVPGGIQTLDVDAEPRRTTRARRPASENLFERFKFIGYPCLVAGFMLVITGKGCDSLGQRWANRLSANSRIAETKFNSTYEKKINAYQAQIDEINDSDNPDANRISDLNKRISDLNKERSKERQRLMRTTWYDLKTSASMAQANNQAWGFYRELIFVGGSMVLSIGLLIIGITGANSERWICLIMLAIITFSIYIGGFAWFSSIQGNIPTSL